ncbi:MAG: hypothetical protein ACR2GU_12770 [Rubrobacteraceae bacterium]
MTSERPFKVEVDYQGRSVFKAGYHDSLEEAEKDARERLNLDESVYEARVLDHNGRVIDTLKKERA